MAQHERWMALSAERMRKIQDQLLSPTERALIEKTYGDVIGPILDAKLEAKAQELVERYRLAWTSAFDHLANPGEREKLLVSRDEVADLLGCSLATVKRMEADGRLSEPVRISERVVRHRLVDIERLARRTTGA